MNSTSCEQNKDDHGAASRYKLPSWFNYEAYKHLFGKRYKWGALNELHKRIYLNTSVHVFEQRALFRAHRLSSLASINELSDLVSIS